MKRERIPSIDDPFTVDDSHRRPFLHMYDNPDLKLQRQLRWQLNTEYMQSKRDYSRSSKGSDL
jgi:hypothetical protein